MSEEAIRVFKRLWTYERDKYVLYEFLSNFTNRVHYIIYQPDTDMLLTIEDNDIYWEVIKRMKQAGVKIVNEPPWSEDGN